MRRKGEHNEVRENKVIVESNKTKGLERVNRIHFCFIILSNALAINMNTPQKKTPQENT